MEYGGLIVDQINSKFIRCDSNGVAVFTCLQIGVATQFRSKSTPFLIPMHCMAHWINLIVRFFYVQPLVVKLEGLLQTTYIYFSSSLKRHLEQCALAKLLEIKRLKLFYNVKTKWISMLSLAKWVFA
jgi:hypothetical protein